MTVHFKQDLNQEVKDPGRRSPEVADSKQESIPLIDFTSVVSAKNETTEEDITNIGEDVT